MARVEVRQIVARFRSLALNIISFEVPRNFPSISVQWEVTSVPALESLKPHNNHWATLPFFTPFFYSAKLLHPCSALCKWWHKKFSPLAESVFVFQLNKRLITILSTSLNSRLRSLFLRVVVFFFVSSPNDRWKCRDVKFCLSIANLSRVQRNDQGCSHILATTVFLYRTNWKHVITAPPRVSPRSGKCRCMHFASNRAQVFIFSL